MEGGVGGVSDWVYCFVQMPSYSKIGGPGFSVGSGNTAWMINLYSSLTSA